MAMRADLADPALADAIPGRLVHDSYRLALAGASMRKRRTTTKKVATARTARRPRTLTVTLPIQLHDRGRHGPAAMADIITRCSWLGGRGPQVPKGSLQKGIYCMLITGKRLSQNSNEAGNSVVRIFSLSP